MYTIPSDYIEELNAFRNWVEEAQHNKNDEVAFKIQRVTHGIYEQRSKGSYMVRIRCAGGVISPEQIQQVCDIARTYGSNFLHITTRQEIQLHNLSLSDTPDILDALYKIGLSTKGGGGNTIRNITASIDSGIDHEEVFDVTPYNIALTNFLIARTSSFSLPRKLKIAFSNSAKDTALAAYNDLGFIAKIKDGKKGFKVFVGGSPSVKPMIGHVLFDFIPESEMYKVALTVIDFFNEHGNRKKRHKARLRYVFYKYGAEKTLSLIKEVYQEYKKMPLDIEPVSVHQNNTTDPDLERINLSDERYERWIKNYVQLQKQDGLYTVTIPVMHGNITLNQAISIAQFAEHLGDDTIRFSRRQNLHLRHIPKEYLGNVYQLLSNSGLETNKPALLGNMVSCTGADTCQLGICFSKGGMQAIHDKLAESELVDQLEKIDINISGCPNSCGQHLVADLGFAGRVSRNGRIYPSYNVFAGGVIGEDNPALPIQLGEIAAKDIPEFTQEFLESYLNTAKGKSVREFITDEKDHVNAIFEKYKNIPAYEEDKSYYIDWGNNDLFTLEARGGGECSAGLLDMIESEIKIIKKCTESLQGQQEVKEQTVLLQEMVISSSKLLCLTHQKQLSSEQEIFDEVKAHLLDYLNFPEAYGMLGDLVLTGNFTGLIKHKDIAMEYAQEVLDYYQSMDDSLQPADNMNEITATELHERLINGITIELIDVREQWEKEIADIGGKLIPLHNIEENPGLITKDKTTVLYCRTGRRSAEAIRLLTEKHGHNNLYNLKGGVHTWADEIDPNMRKY